MGADIDVGEKMCTCLGNRVSGLCLHISGMNFDHRQILASKYANAQTALLPGTFFNHQFVGDQVDGNFFFVTPRAFRQQSMVPRCENQSHGLLRYLVHLFCHKVHFNISSVWMLWVAQCLVQRGLGHAMFDMTTFGAYAVWCGHIEPRFVWFGLLELRDV